MSATSGPTFRTSLHRLLLRRLRLRHGVAVCSLAIVAMLTLGSEGLHRPTDLRSVAADPEVRGSPPGERLLRRLGTGAVPDGLGVNIAFTREHREDVQRIRALGFRLIRLDLLWDSVEARPGTYDWARYDELLAQLEEVGIVPLLILAYSNPLYAPAVPNRIAPHLPAYAAPQHGPARAAFMAFARAAATRYARRAILEIWNEPNLSFGDPVNLTGYVDFAMEACAVIREVEPEAAVLAPASAGFEWRLLADILTRVSDGCFDGLTVHPYRDAAPESVLQDWSRLQGLVSQRAHRSRQPVPVSGEWGYSSPGGESSEQRQADYVVRLYLLNLMAGVPITIIYNWQNDSADPREEWNFGLIDFRGFEKPVHDALGRIVSSLRGLHYIGRVRTRPSDFLLAFGRNDAVERLVGWTTAGSTTDVVLNGSTCVEPTTGMIDPAVLDGCSNGGTVIDLTARLRLSSTPVDFPASGNR